MNLLTRLDPGTPAPMVAALVLAIVTVVTLGAGVLDRLLKRSAASTRHDVQLVALLILLLSPAIVLGVGRSGLVLVRVPIEPARPPVEVGPLAEIPPPIRPLPIETKPEPIEAMPEPPILRPIRAEVAPPSPPMPIPAEVARPEPVASFDGRAALSGGLVAIWAGGVGLLATRLILGLISLLGLRRRLRPISGIPLDKVRSSLGTNALPPIFEASGIEGPLAGGIFRPIVVLPSGMAGSLGEADLRDVLIHECAHIVRRDPLIGLLQRLAAALFWPHPLVHRLNRRLARLREEACDDLVLKAGDPCGYARMLLRLAERAGSSRRDGVVFGLFETRWKLEDRVSGILDRGRNPMIRANRWSKLVVLAILVPASLAIAAIRPGAGAVEPVEAKVPVDDGPATVIEGQVVDEAGAAVAGASVNVTWFRKAAEDAKTGPDGRFSLRIGGPLRSGELVRASAEGDARLGLAQYSEPVRSKSEPLRIVLKPSRGVSVKVVDATGQGVEGAAVEVNSQGHGPLARTRANQSGLASFHLPADAEVDAVAALKDGVGFDYFENYRSWPSRSRGPLPGEITLVLDGARSARVRAVDSSSQPVFGVEFHPQLIQKPGKISYFNATGSDIVLGTTDEVGIARFDWLPKVLEMGIALQIRPWNYQCPDRPTLEPGGDGAPITARILRTVRLSGKVTNIDGSPARGVMIKAESRGKSTDHGLRMARTGDDGMYSLDMPPDQMALIAVVDLDRAAAPLSGIVVREGKPLDGLDLRLVEGAKFVAKLMKASGNEPLAGGQLAIQVRGADLPEEFQGLFSQKDRQTLTTWVKADAGGRIELRLGPGDYTILGQENLHVDGSGEIVREYHLAGPPAETKFESLTGIVVDVTGADEKPVPGALVQFWPSTRGREVRAVADAAGRFKLEPMTVEGGLLVATDRDGTLAGSLLGSKDGEDVKIALSPAATASGRVVDSEGRPIEGRQVQRKAMIPQPDLKSFRTDEITTTGPDGGYRFSGLIPGSQGEILVMHNAKGDGSGLVSVEKFSVRGPDPIALPDIKIPAIRRAEPKVAEAPAFDVKEVATANPMPYAINRADVEALIRTIAREPSTPALVETIGLMVRPQNRWITDLGRITQLATDPAFNARADRISLAVAGKPADTKVLVELAILSGFGHDEAGLRQSLRDSINARQGRAVGGTVVDPATGRPIAGAHVFDGLDSTWTDDRGRYTLNAVVDQSVWIEAEGFALTESPIQAEPVGLDREEPILGVVVDREGKPVEGATVWAMVRHAMFLPGQLRAKGGHYGFPLTARSDARGRFAFRGMPPGASLDWLDVFHPRYRFVRDRDQALKAGVASKLVVEPGCVVSGEVVDESGRGVPGACVQIIAASRNGSERETFTDREGRYRFDNAAQGMRVLSVQPEAHAPKSITIVADPARPVLNQVVVEPGGYVGGKVVDQAGRPVAGAYVGWVQTLDASGVPQEYSTFQKMTATAPDGTFRLDALPPGEFQITASSAGRQGKATGKLNRANLVIKLGN